MSHFRPQEHVALPAVDKAERPLSQLSWTSYHLNLPFYDPTEGGREAQARFIGLFGSLTPSFSSFRLRQQPFSWITLSKASCPSFCCLIVLSIYSYFLSSVILLFKCKLGGTECITYNIWVVSSQLRLITNSQRNNIKVHLAQVGMWCPKQSPPFQSCGLKCRL